MRKNSGLTPLNYCLGTEGNLPKVLRHAAYLRELDRKFQLKLPLALRGLCSIANIRKDILVLICHSQLEASKVRMHSRVILQLIQQDFKITAKKLKIIIKSQA